MLGKAAAEQQRVSMMSWIRKAPGAPAQQGCKNNSQQTADDVAGFGAKGEEKAKKKRGCGSHVEPEKDKDQ